MRNNTEIQIIGYVYQDARCPNERDYPNWVTFKMSVNKKYKDKNGQEQQDSTWFECKSNSEKMSKNIKTLKLINTKPSILKLLKNPVYR